ncbi:MAG TPA: DUF86 domain-containing protein [Solirubrobacterales bacterium]
MVDRPKVESRLERLRLLLDELEQIRAAGREAYDAELRQRLATQRALQLAIQACIDIAGHLLADSGEPIPPNYRALFPALTEQGLDSALAERLATAAGLRDILVHDYLDIDEDVVWGSLEHLDDLRGFAAFAEARLG